MSIAKLKLDESTKLDFGVSITGTDGKPEARFVIDGKDFSICLPCKPTNEGVEVDIPNLKNIFTAGEYSARLEIVIENKIYTPLIDKIEFEPSVAIKTESKAPIKESIKVEKVTVKKQVVNEDQLRKTQAATIIATSLGYTPTENQTPKEIVNSALSQASNLTNEQIETVREMLALAEAVGINYNKDLEPIVVEEIVETQQIVEEKQEDEDGWSEKDLDDMAGGVSSWEHIVDAYEPGELHLVDSETGEHVDDLHDEMAQMNESEELNEILSRIERIKARIRFHKTAEKRERKLHVALHKHSNAQQINKRARHLAIKTMKEKLAKKPLENLSVAEKERIEGIIAKRKNVIDRLALKLTARVRKIEKDRLAGPSTK